MRVIKMFKRTTAAIICFVMGGIGFTGLIKEKNKEKISEEKYANAVSAYKTEADGRYSVYGGIMENLQEKYTDICGWINVADTKICYPLLLTTDNEYYVRRAYDGTMDKNGSVIVDYRSDRSLMSNRNIILYGHNMASGNMFAYLSKPERFINAEIEIYSDGVLGIYKPYAAYIEGGNEFVKLSFSNEAEIERYISDGIQKTIVDFDTVPQGTPYLLTLITCESNLGLGDKRIVIHAVRTELILP